MNFYKHLKVIKLLVLKNWRIRFHYKISFGLLFVTPIIFTAVIVWLTRSMGSYFVNKDVDGKLMTNATRANAENIFSPPESTDYIANHFVKSKVSVVYYPSNSYTDALMQRAVDLMSRKLNFLVDIDLISVKSQQEIIKFKKKSLQAIGVDFISSLAYEHLKYKIIDGFKSYDLDDFKTDILSNLIHSKTAYLTHGFCALQLAIDLSHISLQTNTSFADNIDIFQHKMPLPPIKKIFSEGKYKVHYFEYYTTFSRYDPLPLGEPPLNVLTKTRVKGLALIKIEIILF